MPPESSEADSPESETHSPQIQESLKRYWRSNIKIMLGLLLVWAFAGLGCGVLFADALNAYQLAGYPLGFWFAQQGAIVVFVFLILIYAFLLNRLDRKHLDEIKALKTDGGGQ